MNNRILLITEIKTEDGEILLTAVKTSLNRALHKGKIIKGEFSHEGTNWSYTIKNKN